MYFYLTKIKLICKSKNAKCFKIVFFILQKWDKIVFFKIQNGVKTLSL